MKPPVAADPATIARRDPVAPGHAVPVVGAGAAGRTLTPDDVQSVLRRGFDPLPLDGQRVLVIVPDGTRTMPMPALFDALGTIVGARVAALDYLVALGTHQPMTDDALSRHVGHEVAGGRVGRSHIFNHRWDQPETFVTLGVVPASEIATLTGGLVARDVPVTLNRLVLAYDHLVVCGPVFPHEVVGFSGGNKYFVPGIAGPEIIDFTHWLGALMTSREVIGAGYTPVRAVIDRAAMLIPRPVTCVSLVVSPAGVHGVYVGAAGDAWRAAAALSRETHIVRVAQPFTRVLSIMPEMYADIWTAAKGMYKLEPAVADGGEIVIFAPHISELSYTHGRLIEEVGYHCRDYFLGQWDRFGHYPGGVLAHATHLAGQGAYDATTGVETLRVRVSLATAISRERCARVNLGYVDPATIDPRDWRNREGEGVVLVPRAGEMLYRLDDELAGREH